MFRVEYVVDDQWKIVDQDDEVAFVGTLREVEDWLDFQENARRERVSTGGWLCDLVDAFCRIHASLFPIKISQRESPLTVVKYGAGDQWTIIDQNDSVLFVGTMQEAEDWLDFQENALRQPVPSGERLQNIVDAWHRLSLMLCPARIPPLGSRLTVAEFLWLARHH